MPKHSFRSIRPTPVSLVPGHKSSAKGEKERRLDGKSRFQARGNTAVVTSRNWATGNSERPSKQRDAGRVRRCLQPADHRLAVGLRVSGPEPKTPVPYRPPWTQATLRRNSAGRGISTAFGAQAGSLDGVSPVAGGTGSRRPCERLHRAGPAGTCLPERG